ncbi:MAG: flagellar motor protein MotB [Hyphomicrobiaceae bacterium]
MSSDKDQAAEEIVVVRRRAGNEDDHHHGGVWKIAYADFMTAMMAFFLVMWLINASNTETKARVASYFNPIKLMDSIPRKKGLRNADDKPDVGEKPTEPIDGQKPSAEKKEKKEERKTAGLEGTRDGAGHDCVMPETRHANADPAVARQERRKADGRSERAGEAFRDPFNPESSARLFVKDDTPSRRPTDATAPATARPGEQSTAPPAPQERPGVPAPVDETAGRIEAQVEAKALETAAAGIRRQAEAALRQAGISGGPAIDVTIEGDAIVLSLTDTSTFGMFAIGSAEPNDDLVKLIQRIAPLLAGTGQIMVRGHTDSRPFRSEQKNNNWRLAMGRAEAAYAMLLRAGVEEARFERIEAYADRKPKVVNQPEAAANRRIDILMRKGAR